MQRLLELVRSQELGHVRHIDASYLGPTLPDDYLMLTDPALGGGTLMHMGCYLLHFARTIAGEPHVARAEGQPRALGSDDQIEADLEFPNSVTARIVASMTAKPSRPPTPPAAATIRFDRGEVALENFVLPHMSEIGNRFVVRIDDNDRDETFDGETTYWHQLRAFVDAACGGSPMHTSGMDTLNQMRAIDAVYEAAGFRTNVGGS